MDSIRFDTYYRYDELSQHLNAFAEKNPHLISIESIGKSYEGRDIWLLSVTKRDTGEAASKPAFWVDGNLHAAELVGSMACLYLLQFLVDNYGRDSDVTRCLDTRAFYICPRVNPDGAEWALADVPKIVRSSTRPYPFPELPIDGLKTQDVDGDGRILTMRVRDANGHWKGSPKDKRLLIPRDPAEFGGEYYRLLPEGLIDNFDGFNIRLQDKRERLDMNRNFPAQWRQEHEQKGAGEYPTSEPEVRAEVDFIAKHANICGGITFHSYSGALLRPFSYKDDKEMCAEDLWTYQTIGEKGTALTGYPAVSVYHDFRYHPQEVITGALDDWLYEHRGVFAWTVEIWSPMRQAGIKDFRLFDWYRSHPQEDDHRLLKWNDGALKGQGFVDWYPFEHPQLGHVELGGWNSLFSFWNPPPHLLAKELMLFPRWALWHCMISPKLEWRGIQVERLTNDHFRIRCGVQNTGWLPTHVSKLAQKHTMTRGVLCEIDLPAGVHLVSGKSRQDLGQLEGRNGKNSSIHGWAAQVADPTHDRATAEWVVQSAPGTHVRLTAWHDRAGKLAHTIELTT